MGWTNYHGHCKYCDGKGEVEEYIIKAIELGMEAIGMSSHAPVPFPTDWTMAAYRLDDYLAEMKLLKEKYKEQINVYCSLEVDYIPQLASPSKAIILNAGLDYTVGSIHFVEQLDDGIHWAIDGSVDEFKHGLNTIFGGDIKRAVMRYYELQREMLEYGTPIIIGHMDKIKMHNKALKLFDEGAQWYIDEVYKTLELIKEKGVIVEINTKAYYRNGHLFPGPEHFAKIKALDIPVTINSDAHHPDRLVNAFEEVAEILLKAGFTHLTEFINDKWTQVEFSKEGIAITA